MRGEEQLYGGALRCIDLFKCLSDQVGLGFDEQRVIETFAHFLDGWCTFAHFLLSDLDVLAILSAAGIATEHAGEEGDRAAFSVGLHLTQCIRDHRVPIAIAPVDWKIDSVGIEFGAQSGDEGAVLSVDGADAVEVLVVFGDFHHSFAWNVLASQHILQKWKDFIRAFRATERDQQNRVERDLVGHDRLLCESRMEGQNVARRKSSNTQDYCVRVKRTGCLAEPLSAFRDCVRLVNLRCGSVSSRLTGSHSTQRRPVQQRGTGKV